METKKEPFEYQTRPKEETEAHIKQDPNPEINQGEPSRQGPTVIQSSGEKDQHSSKESQHSIPLQHAYPPHITPSGRESLAPGTKAGDLYSTYFQNSKTVSGGYFPEKYTPLRESLNYLPSFKKSNIASIAANNRYASVETNHYVSDGHGNLTQVAGGSGFRPSSPKSIARYSTHLSSMANNLTPITQQPALRTVRSSHNIIEHPPIIRAQDTYERQSNVHQSLTNLFEPRAVSVSHSVAPPQTIVHPPQVLSTNFFEKVITKKDESSVNTKTISIDEYNAFLKLRERNDELMGIIHRNEIDYKEDKETISRLKSSIQEYIAKLAELEDKVKKATHERDDISYKYENCLATISHLKARIEELESESKSFRLKASRLEDENSTLSSQKGDLEVQIRKLQAELSAKNALTDLNTNDLVNRLKIAEEKNLHLEQRLLDSEDAFGRLSREFKEYKEKATLNTMIPQEKVVIKQPEVDTSGFDSLMAQLKEKNLAAEDLRNKIDQLEAKLRKAEHNLLESSHELESERSKLHNAQNNLSQKENEVKNLNQRLEELQRKLEDSHHHYRDEKEKSANNARVAENYRQRCKNLEDELDALKREKNSLTMDKKVLEGTVNSLENDVNKVQRSFDNKSEAYDKLQDEMNGKKNKIQELERIINELSVLNGDLKVQIESLENTINRLEKEKADPSQANNENVLMEEINRLKELLGQTQEDMEIKSEEFSIKVDEYEAVISEIEDKRNNLLKIIEEYEEKIAKLSSDQEQVMEVSEKLIADNTAMSNNIALLEEDNAELRRQLMMLQNELAQMSATPTGVDVGLSSKLAAQLKRLININAQKEEEIQDLSVQLDNASMIANERLVTIEKLQIDNGRLINQVAEVCSEVEKRTHQGMNGTVTTTYTTTGGYPGNQQASQVIYTEETRVN